MDNSKTIELTEGEAILVSEMINNLFKWCKVNDIQALESIDKHIKAQIRK